eukprot:scaffold1842_cov148-Amphora_coffeaeformis.AAC.2
MSPTASKETGLRLSKSLDQLLEVLPSQAEEKLVEGVSRCFGRGHPLPEETSTSATAVLINDFAQQLRKDPSRRHFVVDRDSLVTDDAGWLVAARCAMPSTPLQWAITTVRSLERSVYDNCYEAEWKIQHATGPRGSAVVTKRGAGDSNACHQAFFSDMPSFVAATGKQLGSLYPSQLIVRVLRTAPRSSLNDRLTRILQQPNVRENVFTLWIRHHEAIADLPGLGKYRYNAHVRNTHSVLELLTDIVEEQEDANLPSSPLAHDFVQASQAPPQRYRPQATPTSAPPQARAFSFDNKTKMTDKDVTKDSAILVTMDAAEGPAKSESTFDSTDGVGTNIPKMFHAPAGTCEVEEFVATAKEETKSSVPDAAALESPVVLVESKDVDLPTDSSIQAAQESTKINETPEDSVSGKVDAVFLNEVDAVEQTQVKASPAVTSVDGEEVNTMTTTSEGSNSDLANVEGTEPDSPAAAEEKSFETRMEETTDKTEEAQSNKALSLLGSIECPTVFTLEPMGLATVVSASTDVYPLDTQYDDLEIAPTWSFDEEDATLEKTSNVQGDANPTSPTESKSATPTNPQRKIVEPDAIGTDNQEEVVTAPNAVKLNSKSEIEVDDTEKEEVSVQVAAESETVDPEATQSSVAPSKRQTKKVRCVGCGTKKDRTEFSNSQLKKKKNNRCLQCVRANCLGPSNNN